MLDVGFRSRYNSGTSFRRHLQIHPIIEAHPYARSTTITGISRHHI